MTYLGLVRTYISYQLQLKSSALHARHVPSQTEMTAIGHISVYLTCPVMTQIRHAGKFNIIQYLTAGGGGVGGGK